MTQDDLDRLSLEAEGNASAEANFGLLLTILHMCGGVQYHAPRALRPNRTASDTRTKGAYDACFQQ